MDMLKLDTKTNLAGMTSGRIDIFTMKDPKKIQTDTRLQIFDGNNAYEEIKASMEKDGYNTAHPIEIGKIKSEDAEYVVEGNTRLRAALELGLEEIPVTYKTFENIDDAVLYAFQAQKDRRNLTPEGILEVAEKLNLSDFTNKAELLAQITGQSKSTAKKAMFAAKNMTEDDKEAVKTGETSINKFYNDKHPKQKKEPSGEDKSDIDEPEDEISGSDGFDDFSDSDGEETDSDALEDTSGNPHGLSITDHSDGIERPYKAPYEEDETDRWIKEKNLQVEEARREGFADGFRKALYFALGETLKGRTPKEIYNDEKLKDLGKDVIPSFVLPDGDEDAVLELVE